MSPTINCSTNLTSRRLIKCKCDSRALYKPGFKFFQKITQYRSSRSLGAKARKLEDFETKSRSRSRPNLPRF